MKRMSSAIILIAGVYSGWVFLKPYIADIHFNRALCSGTTRLGGCPDSADNSQFYSVMFEEFQRAIELNPHEEFYFVKLGEMNEKILFATKDKIWAEKAIESYSHALFLNPQRPYNYENLGRVFYVCGRLKESVLMYKKALELGLSIEFVPVEIQKLISEDLKR